MTLLPSMVLHGLWDFCAFYYPSLLILLMLYLVSLYMFLAPLWRGALNCIDPQTETYIDGQQPQARQTTPTQPSPSAQAMQVTFIVPNGARPGEVLNVALPDGRQVPATLPAGIIPGQTLQLIV